MAVMGEQKLTTVPCPIRDFLVKDICFIVFVETESEHTTLMQNALFDDENVM